VEDLLRSPLGQVVRGLHFHMGHEAIDDLMEALSHAKNLERLSLEVMGLDSDNMRHLLEVIPDWPLREIDVRGNPLGSDAWDLVHALPESIHTLSLGETRLAGQASRALANLRNLRQLDLSRNRLPSRLVHALSRWPWLAGLRSLNLNRCGLTGRELFWLTHAPFWPNLVELDLRENPIPGAGFRHLLDAPFPADLTALVLTGDTLHSDAHAELRRKYGERVIFVAREVVGL
jgi:Ran GTPase-activating protein (RanGAP) involved in mRNA processing and transport